MYTKEQDEDDPTEFWIVDPEGVYLCHVRKEDIDILLSHLNRGME